MIAMNFLRNSGKAADYIVTGSWSEKAMKEAKTQGEVCAAWNGKSSNYQRVPPRLTSRSIRRPRMPI